jgi:hypothetical protein
MARRTRRVSRKGGGSGVRSSKKKRRRVKRSRRVSRKTRRVSRKGGKKVRRSRRTSEDLRAGAPRDSPQQVLAAEQDKAFDEEQEKMRKIVALRDEADKLGGEEKWTDAVAKLQEALNIMPSKSTSKELLAAAELKVREAAVAAATPVA